jgi:hypothetical protein
MLTDSLHSLPSNGPRVRAKTDLKPLQQGTPLRFQKACDYHERWMMKYNASVACFHSLPELLHAAILEGDPSVETYVPQPFRLFVGNRRYTPDCYYRKAGKSYVVEIKPHGDFNNARRVALEAFFKAQNMLFLVLSNESVMERAIEAYNWLMIVALLHAGRDHSTDVEEASLLEHFAQEGGCQLQDIVDPGDRARTYFDELSLFRLLHQGVLNADLTQAPLNYDTGFTLCT